MEIIRLGIFGVIALVAFFVADPFTASSTEVGACLKGDVGNANSVEKPGCGAPDANFKVVGKQDGKSEIGLELSGGSECDDYPTTDAYFFRGEDGSSDGTLLCREDLKNRVSGRRSSVTVSRRCGRGEETHEGGLCERRLQGARHREEHGDPRRRQRRVRPGAVDRREDRLAAVRRRRTPAVAGAVPGRTRVAVVSVGGRCPAGGRR